MISFFPLVEGEDAKTKTDHPRAGSEFTSPIELYVYIPYNRGSLKGGESMPTAVEKPYRMDIRLTQPQRMSYEKAASLRGQTLTQWVTSHLDESARHDIDEATSTVLSSEAFDAFCEMLDAPMPNETQELLSRKPVWE